ncbi:hypothetical protein ASG01_06060 [Chryseobacterium sp. Leaf180]|uniref:hypothetical protein n=1 Tax=Chryseobacterium sp. Leaf180 TaxID=1736289 RepID=UPI000700E60D|nr:hypothetical protein [Chryseobacterium sp. Leaf180]KQR95408.1 hypothetical protein ASG01_06060 [Chryseobacterium sp. Leaf180]
MKNIFLSATLLSLAFVSCKKDEKPTYLDDKDAVASLGNMPNQPSKTALLDQAGISTSTAQSGATMVTAQGMNPPHGQPGHRCDIPVGQPLNGAVPQPQTADTQNMTVPANNAVQIDPNSVSPGKIAVDQSGKQIKTAPGMNPPHGQPGHRCDIPVGQPLNSKPAAAATQTVQPAANPQPAQPQQAVANTGPKPKTNPAHGEPWHDCAKQVGAPL